MKQEAEYFKDRKLDRQEKNKSEGLKKGKGATLCSNLC